ncbi:MAG: class I tRNA ligase family protein, partial [Cycloclasticus sp.]|nr:class I tRNA ligase family protein [Cycloclasticus sp.]MBQ0790670.1 class I tRNA ligase family protein [Cycloclasticus sp.]
AGIVKSYAVEQLNADEKSFRRQIHETLSKVDDDFGRRLTFNTAIAANMELLNAVAKLKPTSNAAKGLRHEALTSIVLMLSPIIPHVCDELWQVLGYQSDLLRAPWPTVDADALVLDEIDIVVQVNGKLRAKITVPADADKESVEKIALSEDNVKKYIDDKPIRKVIIVPKKLVNIVI